nr:MAG: fiber protein [Otus scops adenovirus]
MDRGRNGKRRGKKRKAAEALAVEDPSLREQPSTPSNFDLVYPFWFEIETPEINPPFLDPSGPLYGMNGKLYIRLRPPIAEINKAVGLRTDGSLRVNNSGQLGLNVQTGAGIGSNADGLSVLVDGKSIGFDTNGQLQVNVEPQGPLEITSEGLDIKVDNTTIEVDSWELSVKLDPDEPIDAGPNGMKLNIDDTLLIAPHDTTGVMELGVHLNPKGPVTADENGIDLEIDPNTLKNVTADDNTTLTVKLSPQGGITSSENGIQINADNESIECQDNTLQVKLDPAGHLTKTATGLAVDSAITGVTVDPAGPIYQTASGLNLRVRPACGLEIATDGRGGKRARATNATLTTKFKTAGGISADEGGMFINLGNILRPGGPIEKDTSGIFLLYNTDNLENDAERGLDTVVRLKYLSPYCTFQSGELSLNNFSAIARSQAGVNWPCSYFLFMANSSGMVNASLTVLLDKTRITTMGSGPAGKIQFTFIVSTNPTQYPYTNHSNLSTPVLYPDDPATISFFAPALTGRGSFTVPNSGTNWYVDSWSRGVEFSFIPSGNNFTYGVSYIHFYPASVTSHETEPPVIVMNAHINLNPATQNWYTNSGSQSMNTGPILFSYYSSIPNFEGLPVPRTVALPESFLPSPSSPEPPLPDSSEPEPTLRSPTLPPAMTPEPALPSPTAPEPVLPTEPTLPSPTAPEPILPAEPALPSPTDPEPVLPEPAIPEPALPEPAVPEPVVPEPIIPEPVVPAPILPEPSLPPQESSAHTPKLPDTVEEVEAEILSPTRGDTFLSPVSMEDPPAFPADLPPPPVLDNLSVLETKPAIL